MKLKKLSFVLGLCIAVSILSGCRFPLLDKIDSFIQSLGRRSDPANGAVLAWVEKSPITVQDYLDAYDAMGNRPGAPKPAPLTKETFQSADPFLIEHLIERLSIKEVCRKLGFLGDSEYRERIRQAEADYLRRRLLDHLGRPTEDDVTKYYNQHKIEYTPRTELACYRMVFFSSITAEEALRKIKSGKTFEQVLIEYSTSKMLVSQGSTDPMIKGRMEPPLEKALGSLGKNEVSEIVRNGKNFEIYKVQGSLTYPGMNPEQAKNQIRSRLENEKISSFVAKTVKIRKEYKPGPQKPH